MAAPKKPESAGATPPAPGPDPLVEAGRRIAALEENLHDVCARHAADIRRADTAERELASSWEALGAVEAKAQRLANENRALREELESQAKRFDLAWAEREKSPHALPETAPVKGRVLVARHTIRTTGPSGERLKLRAGDRVPEGASLDGLPLNAFTEET